jgi:flagellar basal body rod protein FlgF
MPDPVRLNGMSSSAAALQMLERRQQVLSNNLANASTRGFKAESAFTRMMNDAMASTDTALDLTQGTLTETHNTLDLAIEGDGFFVTQTPAGERFVRNGSFRLDADHRHTMVVSITPMSDACSVSPRRSARVATDRCTRTVPAAVAADCAVSGEDMVSASGSVSGSASGIQREIMARIIA